MRVSILRLAALSAFAFAAQADFSYTSTSKAAGATNGTVSKHKIKGSKMRLDTADTSMITDFDAQTLTTLHHSSKTYSVLSMPASMEAAQKSVSDLKADVKETGQQKKIGGYNCRQVVMTIQMNTQGRAMTMETEMWLSPDIAGAAELKALGARMAERGIFPGGGDPQSRSMMLDMQKQTAKLNGMTVMQITRMKLADDAQSKQMQAQMEAMRTQMEAMKKMGGKQAEMAEKALASIPAAGGKFMSEMITESSDFSTASIPASEFAIPAGYKKADR